MVFKLNYFECFARNTLDTINRSLVSLIRPLSSFKNDNWSLLSICIMNYFAEVLDWNTVNISHCYTENTCSPDDNHVKQYCLGKHAPSQMHCSSPVMTQWRLTSPDTHFPTQLLLKLTKLLATPCSIVTMQYTSPQEELYCQRGHKMTRDKAEPSSSRSWREDEPCLSFVFNMNYPSSSPIPLPPPSLQVWIILVCPLLHFPPFLPLHFHSPLFCSTILIVLFSFFIPLHTYHSKQCPQTNHHL